MTKNVDLKRMVTHSSGRRGQNRTLVVECTQPLPNSFGLVKSSRQINKETDNLLSGGKCHLEHAPTHSTGDWRPHRPQLETGSFWKAKFSRGVVLFSPRRDDFYFLSQWNRTHFQVMVSVLSLREFSLSSPQPSAECWEPQFVLQAVTVTLLAPATFDHIGSRGYYYNPKHSRP